MNKLFALALTASFALVLTNCQSNESNEKTQQTDTSSTVIADTSVRASLFLDPHSYSTMESKVTALHWDANVDFQTEVISATAHWTLQEDHGDSVIFDVKNLDISEVLVDGVVSDNWNLDGNDELLGSALIIPLNLAAKQVSISYRTSPTAEALQWYPASLTQGKRQPFLFTQSQAILARTWIPCQDRPGVRFTYTAKVKVPKQTLALMSASNPVQKNETGVYEFNMPQPIPSYLLALGVGDLEFIALGERSGVYAE